MEKIQNEYQNLKTLRFGLTLKEKARKKGFAGEIHQSHKELQDLIQVSEKRIRANIKQNISTGIPIDKIEESLNSIEVFLDGWKHIYNRTDQIALDKDFYKKITKKIGFEGFWYENYKNGQKIKKPQSREIKLSDLNRKDSLGKERKAYIVDFWENNLRQSGEKLQEVKIVFERFQAALIARRDDERPNEVEMRKMYLALAGMILEVLTPLGNGSITFPGIEKLSDNFENKNLLKFAVDNEFRMNCLNQIEDLKTYFSENGGNVPYLRATLNPLTLIKNPNSTDSSIEPELNAIGLEKYLSNL